MTVVSHLRAATTQVGFMPKDYRMLNEEDCPQALGLLYKERMDIYYEKIVKQKIDEGIIPSFKAFRQSRRLAPTVGNFGGVFALSQVNELHTQTQRISETVAMDMH